MTIHEAITRFDAMHHNTFSNAEKVYWLSLCDGYLRNEIIDLCEGHPQESFTGYDASTPVDTLLLAPHPYDEIYLHQMAQLMYYLTGEIEKYNNAIQMFSRAYVNFRNYYNRTHMPKGQKWRFG